MIRNVKVLGLALTAVLAISAVAASAASAQAGKLTSDGPVTLDMTPLEGKANALTFFGEKTECAKSVLTGHRKETTKETEEGKFHELIPLNAQSVTITLDALTVNCSWDAFPNRKLTVTTNGCDYDFNIGKTVAANQYGLTADIVCPPGKDIQWEVYAFAASELGGVQCTLTVKEQVGLAGPTLTTDTANDDLRIEGAFSGVQLEKSGSGCSTTAGTGEWHINVTVEGKNEEWAPTGITVTD